MDQIGFGSGFKVNSAVWKALRTFQDPNHMAWSSVTKDEVETMWSDLDAMGVKFVNGVIPPAAPRKKPGKGSKKADA